jgi:hypothetical protein
MSSQIWEATMINSSVDQSMLEQIKLSPNPVMDKLNISFSFDGNLDQWSILDALGKIVLSSNKINLSDKMLNVHVDQLTSGTYFYSCKKDGKKYITKFIKI